MSTSWEDILEEAGQSPRRAKGDGQEVEAHPIPDLIKLADRQQQTAALTGTSPKLLVNRLVHPGTQD